MYIQLKLEQLLVFTFLSACFVIAHQCRKKPLSSSSQYQNNPRRMSTFSPEVTENANRVLSGSSVVGDEYFHILNGQWS